MGWRKERIPREQISSADAARENQMPAAITRKVREERKR